MISETDIAISIILILTFVGGILIGYDWGKRGLRFNLKVSKE